MSPEDPGTRMSRARTELEVAHLLLERGYPEQAASRVYYAAFYAADAALLHLGEMPSSHSGLIAAFGRLVVKEGGFDPGTGAVLHRLFELRSDADYESGTVTAEQVRNALASAERFVAAVEEWLRGRAQPA